jgi:type VI secretion system secreted protein VgrG
MSVLQFSCSIGSSFDVRAFRVQEALDQLPIVDLEVVCPEPDVDLEALVGKTASFTMLTGYVHAVRGMRTWNGIASRAEQLRSLERGRDGTIVLSTYAIRIVPTLYVLSLRKTSRIFQRLSIPDIVDALLQEWRIAPTWQIDRSKYPKLEVKIQYEETDLDFFRRLLEEAGITFICMSEGDDEKLILSDVVGLKPHREHPAIAFHDDPDPSAEKEYATRLQLRHDVRPGATHHRDFDFRSPAEPLAVSQLMSFSESRYEHFHYQPAAFLAETKKAGSTTPVADHKGIYRRQTSHGEKQAAVTLESLRRGKRLVQFTTNVADLVPGTGFSIYDHPHPALKEKLVTTSMTITGHPTEEWVFQVEAYFANDVIRPAKVTPKPRMESLQSAVVVGPPGEEIHTDEYGRVRVQFPWDREGKSDDNSSCWMRVLQGWAGPHYGMIMIPRIGQEVLVSFLGGDPDAPIVVGRAYNELNPVPYKLPDDKTISGWKSWSSPVTGGYSELKIEDKAEKELVYFRAQRDHHQLVQRDEVERIERNHYRTVLDQQHLTVKSNKRELVKGDVHTHIEANNFERIDGNVSVHIKGWSATESGKEIHLKAPTIVIEASEMTLKGAGGFITFSASGIDIVGNIVNINSGGGALDGRGIVGDDAVKDAEEAHPKDHHKLIEE